MSVLNATVAITVTQTQKHCGGRTLNDQCQGSMGTWVSCNSLSPVTRSEVESITYCACALLHRPNSTNTSSFGNVASVIVPTTKQL